MNRDMTSKMTSVERLIAKTEIEDCMKYYARGVDRRDWNLVRSCFHDDALDLHGEFKGDSEAFIEWVSKRHENVPFSMHYLLNCLIDFETDAFAKVETYFWAIQRRESPTDEPDAQAMDFEVFGRYVDRFECREGGWRIAYRRVVYDSTRTLVATNHLRDLVGICGQRDMTDPIYEDYIPPKPNFAP